MSLSEAELIRIADLVADRVVIQIGKAAENPQYVRGTANIARFLQVSEDTYRRRHRSKIPICGYEEYNHRGKLRVRPVCRTEDLKIYRENLPTKNKIKV